MVIAPSNQVPVTVFEPSPPVAEDDGAFLLLRTVAGRPRAVAPVLAFHLNASLPVVELPAFSAKQPELVSPAGQFGAERPFSMAVT